MISLVNWTNGKLVITTVTAFLGLLILVMSLYSKLATAESVEIASKAILKVHNADVAKIAEKLDASEVQRKADIQQGYTSRLLEISLMPDSNNKRILKAHYTNLKGDAQ